MGTLHGQKFYGLRLDGSEVNFPFAPRPFTALVDSTEPVGEKILAEYAGSLLAHGCVQVACRGDEADLFMRVFERLADEGRHPRTDFPITSMSVDDEPLEEAIQYFVLPSGLASTGVFLVIGGGEAFMKMVRTFARVAGTLRENVREPSFATEELVCFDV